VYVPAEDSIEYVLIREAGGQHCHQIILRHTSPQLNTHTHISADFRGAHILDSGGEIGFPATKPFHFPQREMIFTFLTQYFFFFLKIYYKTCSILPQMNYLLKYRLIWTITSKNNVQKIFILQSLRHQ
jgi:hypothetical protein